MKRTIAAIALLACFACLAAGAFAQDGEASPEIQAAPGPAAQELAPMPVPQKPQIDPPPARVFVFGPRVGFGMSLTTPEDFTRSIEYSLGYETGNTYYPYYSIFGLNLEYRILLGQTRDHFAIQTLGFLFGIEQSLAIPAGALMLGYRSHSGFEFGLGPIFNPGGVGVLGALGFTFSVGGVNIPVDLAFQIPNNNLKAAFSLSTGFNFNYDASPVGKTRIEYH